MRRRKPRARLLVPRRLRRRSSKPPAHRLPLADLLAQLDPVAVRKPHIKNANVELEFVGQFQPLGHRSGSRHYVTKIPERRRDHQTKISVVLDMKDSCFYVVAHLSTYR